MTRRFKTRKVLQRFLAEDSDSAGLTPGLVGSRISKYKILGVIGRGGMGIVYQAEDVELRRTVALKVLREGVIDPRAVQRFHREARIAAQFQHPNIVPIFDVGTIESATGASIHFLAMAYVQGRTLAELIEEGTTKREELLRILEDVSRAVSYAHSKGVIHRDIKPQNVMIDGRGNVLLMDFGLAHASFFETKLTKSQAVMGTPRYMAPEQVLGKTRDIGPSTDIYALGILLYECLTGDIPFPGTTPAEIYQRILHEVPASPRTIEKTIRPDLDVICMKAIEKKPGHRYSQASDFADEIARFRRNEPITARPPSLFRNMGRRVANNRLVLTAVVVGAIFVVLGSAVVIPYLNRAKDEMSRKDRELIESGQKRADALLDSVLNARRAENLERMKERGRELDALCLDLIAKVPTAPQPHYIRGRLFRAEMSFNAALEEQKKALALQPTYVPALYEKVVLGRLLYISTKYAADFHGIVEGSRQLHRTDPVPESSQSAQLKSQLIADLGRLTEMESRKTTLTPAETKFLSGLSLYLGQNLDGSIKALLETIALNPLLEEAYECAINLEHERDRFEEAVRLSTEAIQRDRGYVNYHLARAFNCRNLASQLKARGADPMPMLRMSVDDATWVLKVDPKSEKALVCRSGSLFLIGDGAEGSDQLEKLDASYRDALELHRIRPWTGSQLMVGGCLMNLAECKARQSIDPKETVQEAIRFLDEAISGQERCELGYLWRGGTHRIYGDYLRNRQMDSLASYRSAIADLTTTLEINPASLRARQYRGLCNYQMSRSAPSGVSLAVLYDQAIEDFTKVLEALPSDHSSTYRRGVMFLGRAKDKVGRKVDAFGDLLSANEDFSRFLVKEPDNTDIRSHRAETLMMIASVENRLGKDPTPPLRQAVEDVELVIAKGKANADSYRVLGNSLFLIAYLQNQKGEDAVSTCRRARVAFEKLREMDPTLTEPLQVALTWIDGYLKKHPDGK